MWLMYRLRQRRFPSQLQPNFRIVRTVPPHHVIKDDRTGQWRLTSAAFSPTSDGLVSVDLEQLLAEDGLPPLMMYPALTGSVAAATHRVGDLRASNLEVIHDPVVTNWYHGGISGKLNKKLKQKLAETAGFLVPIDENAAEKFHNASN